MIPCSDLPNPIKLDNDQNQKRDNQITGYIIQEASMALKMDTEARRNFATHSDHSVEINNKRTKKTDRRFEETFQTIIIG